VDELTLHFVKTQVYYSLSYKRNISLEYLILYSKAFIVVILSMAFYVFKFLRWNWLWPREDGDTAPKLDGALTL
jgi:hypothetical protein